MSSAVLPNSKTPFALLRGPLRDLANRVRFGVDAPKSQERIWINPDQMTRVYIRNASVTPDFKRRHSGMVIDGAWDSQTEPLDQSWKIAACLAHFCDGVPWDNTGVYAHMQKMVDERGQFDSCKNTQDVITRYADIDQLYSNILANGYDDETILLQNTPRLPEGVFVHLDRNGDPIFGAIGNHRLGIARALGLKRIPAQLGVVHPGALSTNALDRYRDQAT